MFRIVIAALIVLAATSCGHRHQPQPWTAENLCNAVNNAGGKC